MSFQRLSTVSRRCFNFVWHVNAVKTLGPNPHSPRRRIMAEGLLHTWLAFMTASALRKTGAAWAPLAQPQVYKWDTKAEHSIWCKLNFLAHSFYISFKLLSAFFDFCILCDSVYPRRLTPKESNISRRFKKHYAEKYLRNVYYNSAVPRMLPAAMQKLRQRPIERTANQHQKLMS